MKQLPTSESVVHPSFPLDNLSLESGKPSMPGK